MPDPFLEYLHTRAGVDYDKVVEVYSGPICRLLRRLLPAAVVEETAQEVLLKLSATRKSPQEVTQPKAFILRLAFHIARHRARAESVRARHESNAAKLRPAVSPAASEEAILRERVSQILAAIDALPDKLRAPIHLRAIEGLSYRQIAQVLGITLDAVGVRILRARKQLRASLGTTFGLTWLLGPPWAPERGVFAATDLVQMRSSRVGAPAKAASRVASRHTGARLPSSMMLVCLCLTLLGFLLEGESSRSPRAAPQPLSSLDREPPHPRSVANRAKPGPRAPPRGRRRSPRPRARAAESAPRAQEPDSNESVVFVAAKEGVPDMQYTSSSAAAVLLGLAGSVPGLGADPGDINGDGRVSFADAYQFFQWRATDAAMFTPSPGSLEFSGLLDCTFGTESDPEIIGYTAELIFLEALRRASSDPLPHFIEIWPPAVEQRAPEADPRVRCELLDLRHAQGSNPELDLSLRLTTSVPLDAIAILYRSPLLDLRPATHTTVELLPLLTSSEYYLITRGTVSYRSDHYLGPLGLPAGEHYFSVPAVLPRGTPAGDYVVELLAGTEVVTTDGQALRPEVASGTITITEPTVAGLAQPFPPIPFTDLDGRAIGGDVEFRLTEARGAPGDLVSVRIQVRAERPVNFLPIVLEFDSTVVQVAAVRPAYIDPETGAVMDDQSYHFYLFNGNSLLRNGQLLFYYHPADFLFYFPYQPWAPQSLKYLSPLDEWVDLAELDLQIQSTSVASTPLRLSNIPPEFPAFRPYVNKRPLWVGCGDTARWWHYEPATFQSGELVITDPDEPSPPPPPPVDPEEAQIIVDVSAGEGFPGDTVKLPVFLESAIGLYQVRLVLDYDPAVLQLVGFEADVESWSGEPATLLLTREDPIFLLNKEACDGEGRNCRAGFPILGILQGPPLAEVPANTVLVDLMTTFYLSNQFPGKQLWEPGFSHSLGSIVFQVRPEAPPGRALIAGVEIDWVPERSVVPIHSETAGFPLEGLGQPRADVPAFAVIAGSVTVIRDDADFIRGDSNRDVRVDISDSSRTLSVLFQGEATLPCSDAADANDDGRVDISDAIFTLSYLFLGGVTPPPPSERCGVDPTPDALGCGGLEPCL